MMRVLVVIVSIVLLAITAIAFLPASMAAAFVPSAATRWMQIHAIEGTMWNGRATLSAPNVVPATLPIAWRCSPQFTSLALACELSGALSGRVVAKPFAQSANLENVSVRQSLRATPNAAVSLTAESLDVTITQAEMSQRSLAISAAALAKRTTWKTGNTALELGEVSLDCKPLATDPNASECTLRNRAGATPLDGKLTLTPSKASGYVEYGDAAAKQRISF
jgi:hypothetical protein